MADKYSLGLYEKALPDGLSYFDMFTVAKEQGFDRFEISIDETDQRLSRLDWTCSKQKAFLCTILQSGIHVDTMCLSAHRRFPLGSHDPNIRTQSLEIMKKALEFAHNTGIRIIQLAGYDVYYEQTDLFTREMFLENLRKCVEMASVCGVILAFETMETPFMDTVEKAAYYVELLQSPYLAIYPDIGNLKNSSLLYDTLVTDDIIVGGKYIVAAHLKETSPGIYRDMRFGEGHTEYHASIKALWDYGVHLFTGEFWCLDKTNYIADIKHAALFLHIHIQSAAMLKEDII